ncbi:MAG: GNAT family N-acetyltransferase [Deltaproteobacteria bacterium]|nr:GNAT family N-acetyltransferase [Deltaproteobacteria bacterium]
MGTSIAVRSLTDADRGAIATWHYGGDLAIYDPGPGAMALREPDHIALVNTDGVLLGYGTTGVEARVPGGRYDGDGSDGSDGGCVDLGLGLRPDLVGAGHGAPALLALMAWASRELRANRFRATIAAVNPRANGLMRSLGFAQTHRFVRPRDGRQFVQYERQP